MSLMLAMPAFFRCSSIRCSCPSHALKDGRFAIVPGEPAASQMIARITATNPAVRMSTLADTAVTGQEPSRAIEAAEALLTRLGSRATSAEALLTMPAEQIVSAMGTGAGGDLSLRFVPVVDGRTLPSHPFDPVASDLSATVPLIVGSNECEGIPYGNPDDPYWKSEPTTFAELRDHVKRIVPSTDDDADRLIAIYRSHRPTETPGDIAAVMMSSGALPLKPIVSTTSVSFSHRPVEYPSHDGLGSTG